MNASASITDASVAVKVELFGIARMKAGVNAVMLSLDAAATVADLARELIHVYPDFVGTVLLENGAIADSYVLNRNGLAFLPAEPSALLQLADGDTLLLLPNQAGG